MRIGHGYDVHRYIDGNEITVGGVKIPFEKGILAHSDGDVLIHAISDALLGAASLRDIGTLFPDNDDAYKNIDSKILLKKVADLIRKDGFVIDFIDSTIVAQAPKMSPYILNMRSALADTLEIAPSRINVKATTEEHLGFTGRKEGIAAYAVCILKENA